MISNIEYRSVFGADFCISRDQGVNDEIEISISCSHNTSFPVKPEPTATYLRNGESIEYGERYDFGRNTSLVGISNTFFIYADFSIPSQFDAALGNYTCTLSNLFGTSITTTTITECCKREHERERERGGGGGLDFLQKLIILFIKTIHCR